MCVIHEPSETASLPALSCPGRFPRVRLLEARAPGQLRQAIGVRGGRLAVTIQTTSFFSKQSSCSLAM